MLIIQAVVSNFLDVDISDVLVTLVKSDTFKVPLSNTESNDTQFEIPTDDIQIEIPQIKSQLAKAVSFVITPTKVGYMDITIKAQTPISADAETRKIMVKPEGILQVRNLPYLIEFTKENEGFVQIDTSLLNLLPAERVSDSENCEIQIIGDMLGTAFNNLDRLLNKPTGCGEQNMVHLTPNIFAIKYLNAKNLQNKKVLIDKAKKNIQIGYENQLKYKRNDGSFSAFGAIDNSGSSWLTAFVVKALCQAKEVIEIDDTVIESAFDWILKQQNPDGSFNEPGRLINTNMQGGENSNLTNTIFITISLLESNLSNVKLIKPIERAINYIESQLDGIKDTYTLVLATYALASVRSYKSEDAVKRLDKLSTTTISGYRFWTQNETKQYRLFNRPSSEIEITSYALLAYLQRNRQYESLDIVRWLVNQSNSLGAYSSTQNTIIALQALTEFVIKSIKINGVNQESIKADIQITTDFYNKENNRLFKVREENLLILQQWQLKNCPSQIDIQANGTGNVFLQLVATYNLPQIIEPVVFELNQTIKEQYSVNNLLLKTCVRYNGSTSAKTGMSVIEASILTGFTVNKNELDKLVQENAVNDLKLVEIIDDGTKVAFYFDELDNVARCLEWQIERVYPVALPKPVSVRVYDYYRPEIQKSILFDGLKDLRACDLNNELKC